VVELQSHFVVVGDVSTKENGIALKEEYVTSLQPNVVLEVVMKLNSGVVISIEHSAKSVGTCVIKLVMILKLNTVPITIDFAFMDNGIAQKPTSAMIPGLNSVVLRKEGFATS